MKQLGDYGIAPIKCETRVGGAEVKDWLYKINDILYRHKCDYVCPALLRRLKKELRAVLIDFNNTAVPPIAQTKKNEILKKGKQYFNRLVELEKEFEWMPEDADDIQKVLRYQVSNFVKEKPSLTLVKAAELVKKYNQAFADYYTDASSHISLDKVSTDSFKSVQAELKDYINAAIEQLDY